MVGRILDLSFHDKLQITLQGKTFIVTGRWQTFLTSILPAVS